MAHVIVGSRFYDKRDKREANYEKVERFVDRAQKYADSAVIAVNRKKDNSGILEDGSPDPEFLTLLDICTWSTVSVLNHLVRIAAEQRADYALIHSMKVELTPQQVAWMMTFMDPGTLCVGTRQPEHDFMPGTHDSADGAQVPWNTCCLWNLDFLSGIGIPMVGDAPFDPQKSGVEEGATIAVLQQLHLCSAKLVDVGGHDFDITDDPERIKARQERMQSKQERMAAQFERLDLPLPTVSHIS